MDTGCKGGAIRGVPGVIGLVAPLDEDRLRGVVLWFLGQVVSALDDKDIEASLGKAVGERRPSHATADDDDVRTLLHGTIPSQIAHPR